MLKGKAAIGAVDATLRAIDEMVRNPGPVRSTSARCRCGHCQWAGAVRHRRRRKAARVHGHRRCRQSGREAGETQQLERTRAIASHATYAQAMTQGYAASQ